MKKEIPSDSVLVRNARLAVSSELQKKRATSQPIAKFDKKTGRVFLEKSDGSVVEIGQAMKRGRYSERMR